MIRIQDHPTELGIPYSEFVAALFRPLPPAQKLAHAAMGLVTEVWEANNAVDGDNLAEEIGDIVFFGEAYRQSLPHRPSKAPSTDFTDDELSDGLMMMLDAAKRWLAYDKAPTEQQCDEFGALAEALSAASVDRADDTGEPYEDKLKKVINTNVAKLRTRYRNGFSTQAATDRDTEAELAAIKAGQLRP